MDAAPVTIKTTGQKRDNASNGIPRAHAKTHFSFNTTGSQVGHSTFKTYIKGDGDFGNSVAERCVSEFFD